MVVVAGSPFGGSADSDRIAGPELNKICVGSQNRILFCGPAAICAVTGRPANEVIEVINSMRDNDKSVEKDETGGMTVAELKLVLAKLGYRAEATLANAPDSRMGSEPGVEMWAGSRIDAGELNIVHVQKGEADGHLITTKAGQFVDNGNREPTSISEATDKRYGRVLGVMAVSKACAEVLA